MILVIGGRSKIGAALIDELLDRGEPTRALAREAESRASFPATVETVVGDLADPESLRTAMSGVERVFLLCGPTPDEVALNRNAIDAAAGAGVRLLVRSSILGADPTSGATFARDHGVCDSYLRDTPVPHAIVRPNMFTQNVPESTIPSIDASGTFYANAGDARISMVDTRDVAAVAAALLTEPGHEGEQWDVTGPEALSYADVARKLSDSMGRPVTYVSVADDAVRDALRGLGLGEWMAESLVNLLADYRDSGAGGYAAGVSDTVARLTGREPRTLDELLAESGPREGS
jgi:uncharacterized protein YbjT (DUF2867 family)